MGVELSNAFGQARRSGLQDVGGLDLEDPILSDRGYAVPSRPLDDRRLPHLLPAPRREDDLRVTLRDLRRIDDAILGESGFRQLWKDRLAAGNRHELLDPADA